MNEQNSKKPKSKSSLYVTLLVILMTIALVAAIAGAVARSVKGNEAVTTADETTGENAADDTTVTRQDDNTDDAFVTENETTVYDEKAEKDPLPAETTAKKAAEALPELANPVGGALMKVYSTEVPVFSLTMDDYRTHDGIDIAAQLGSEVKAAAEGTVSEVWDDPMMGKCVSISHSGGAVSTYKNMNAELSENIEKGMSVSAGDVIGTVGESALEEIAEQAHLHFELSVDGVSVNPADYIDFTAAAAVYEG